MSTTLEFVRDGYRFTKTKGGSFINVRPVTALTDSVPVDMITLPDWVNASRFDAQTLRALALDYLAYSLLDALAEEIS